MQETTNSYFQIANGSKLIMLVSTDKDKKAKKKLITDLIGTKNLTQFLSHKIMRFRLTLIPHT
jgi:hypothetical protein